MALPLADTALFARMVANADPFDASPNTLHPDSITNNHTGYPS